MRNRPQARFLPLEDHRNRRPLVHRRRHTRPPIILIKMRALGARRGAPCAQRGSPRLLISNIIKSRGGSKKTIISFDFLQNGRDWVRDPTGLVLSRFDEFCFSLGFGAFYATGLWRDPTGSALSRAWNFASRVGLVRFMLRDCGGVRRDRR